VRQWNARVCEYPFYPVSCGICWSYHLVISVTVFVGTTLFIRTLNWLWIYYYSWALRNVWTKMIYCLPRRCSFPIFEQVWTLTCLDTDSVKNILTVRPRVLIVLTWRYDSACILRNSLIRAANNESMLSWEIQLDVFSVLAAGCQARISRITTAGNSPAT